MLTSLAIAGTPPPERPSEGTVAVPFTVLRDRCVHHHGIKTSHDDRQCDHPGNDGEGSWCDPEDCPLLVRSLSR